MINNHDAYYKIYQWAKDHKLTISIINDVLGYQLLGREFMFSRLKNKQIDLVLIDLNNNQSYSYLVNSKTIDLIIDLLEERYCKYLGQYKKEHIKPGQDSSNESQLSSKEYDVDEYDKNAVDEFNDIVKSLSEGIIETQTPNDDKIPKNEPIQIDSNDEKINQDDDFLDGHQNLDFELVFHKAKIKIQASNLYDLPIELYMKSTVRLMNSLKRSNIFSFRDLFGLSLNEISRIRNLGYKSFKELINNLNDFTNQLDTQLIEQPEIIDIQIDTPTYFEQYLSKIREMYSDQPAFQTKKINEYPLSPRVINALRRGKIQTVEQLTTKDWMFFLHLQNFGRKSFRELRTFLYEHFVINSDTNTAEIGTRVSPFLISYELIQSIDQENAHYSLSQLIHEATYNKIKSYDIELISDLISLDNEHSFFKDRIICNDYEFYEILRVLDTPLETKINLEFTEIVNSLKPVFKDILLMRSQGYTLEKIGQKHQLTRERIRQICEKIVRKTNTKKQFNDIIGYLKIISEGRMYCTKTQLESILSHNFQIFIWFFGDSYDNDLDTLFLNTAVRNEVYQEISNLDSTIILKDFQSDYEFLKHHNILRTYIMNTYNVFKEYAFKHRPTLVELYTIVLKEKFEYMRISDERALAKFREYYFELFGDQDIFSKTSRSITAILQRLPGIDMHGRGEYRFTETKLNANLIWMLSETIEKHGIISFRGLFELHKSELVQSGVTNQFQLHTIIKKNLPKFYTNRDNVSTTQFIYIDIDSSIRHFIMNQNTTFTYVDIKSDIPDITELQLFTHIEQFRDAISMFNRKYMPSRLLVLEEEDRSKLSTLINRILINEGIITSQRLYLEILGEHFNKVIKVNKINNAHYAYQFVRYFLSNEYTFGYNCIFFYNQTAIKQLDYLVQKFIGFNKIAIKDITSYATRNFIYLQNMKTLLDSFYERGYIRLDDDTIINSKLLQFPSQLIVQLEDLIKESIVGEFLSTDEIETFDKFPKISIPWNQHLLAHLIKRYGERYYVLDIGNQWNSLSYQFKEKENE